VSDGGRHEDSTEPTFAPAGHVEFAPDTEMPADAALFEPDTAPPASPSDPQPDGVPGAWEAAVVQPAAFSVAEAAPPSPPQPPGGSTAPLWPQGPPEGGGDPAGPRDNGWLVVTAVLVAVFVALVVGFTALWDATREDQPEARIEGTPLDRPNGDVTTTTPASDAPATTGGTTPTTAVAEWVTVTGPSFTAAFPAQPQSEVSGPAQRWVATADGATYTLLVSSFPAGDEGFLDLGLVGGATDALPSGTPQPSGEFSPYDGGGRAFRFSATAPDGSTYEGRAIVVGGQRYVLTVSTASGTPASSDVERFLGGLQPG
jgi:hypothetical protein